MLSLCLLVLALALAVSRAESTQPLPVVFAYTVVERVCKYGLPEYIKIALEHNIFTQPDCQVILLTNLGECAQIGESVKNVTGLLVVDSTGMTSPRTRAFLNISHSMFQSDNSNELWITSALRFFLLEDLMLSKGYRELLHVEADNLLYGRITTILPILRQHYPLAVTPLNTAKTLHTASVFWISSVAQLVQFNDYMMDLGTDRLRTWNNYLDWLKPTSCCKFGGIRPDANGMGIKWFAVNEMSMLAYYHELHPKTLALLPVVPDFPYITNRNIPRVAVYAPKGSEVAQATGIGIWDPNSWGQFLGGTSRRGGKDRGFTDSSHIAGIAMRVSACRPAMICGNMTEYDYLPGAAPAGGGERRCYTAPFVSCGEGTPLVPVWNLHVHSKHTGSFRSFPCKCNGAP